MGFISFFGNLFRKKKQYIIRKGGHYCLHLPRIVKGNYLKFEVLFDVSCRYVLNTQDQGDINKLAGFAWGHVHQNSYRLGWSYYPEKDSIILWHYSYVNGMRKVEYVSWAKIGVPISIELGVVSKRNRPYARIDGWFNIAFAKPAIKETAALCFPYFGGNCPAPQDVNIQIKWIKR